MFLVRNFKNIIGNMLNSMKEIPIFYSFVYHILSETETDFSYGFFA